MSDLRESIEEYLAIRRSLGFILTKPARDLRDFVAFMEGESAPFITTQLALRWVQQPTGVQPATRAARLATVRRFAAWRSATDLRTEIPPQGLLSHRYRRKHPYIYSDNEINEIVQAARGLPSPRGLRAHTYSTLFGLLAVTGMRVSEAVNLDREDVDPEAGILTILRTKFGKTRLVPVHPSTREALRDYGLRRDKVVSVSLTQGFFVSERGTRITGGVARGTFAKVSREIGLRPPPQDRSPRTRPTAPRHASPIRCPDVDQLVPGRTRCRTRDPQAVCLPRTRAPQRYLLVLGGRA